MKIRVTSPRSIYGKNGEDLVGQTIMLKGQPPAGWKGKYEVDRPEAEDGSVPVTNEDGAPTLQMAQLREQLDAAVDARDTAIRERDDAIRERDALAASISTEGEDQPAEDEAPNGPDAEGEVVDQLRAEYAELTGGHADKRWKEETLREKIDAAKAEQAE